MAFREVPVFEVREVLRLWLRDESLLRARRRRGCLSGCRSAWSPSADGSMPSSGTANPLFGCDAAARFADGYVEALERFLAL